MRLFLLLLLSCVSGWGATRNWTNTWAQTPYHAGDTVLLYGSNWTSVGYGITNSGTTGSPITFQWQPGCSITTTSVGSFFSLDNVHDLIFDGQRGRGAPNDANLRLTDNGTLIANYPGTNHYSAVCWAWYFQNGGATNIKFLNLTMRNLYNRNGTTNGYQDCNWFKSSGKYLMWSNCFLGEAYGGISYNCSGGPNTNCIIFGNTITNYNHGMTIASAYDDSRTYDVYVISNRLEAGDMYETMDVADYNALTGQSLPAFDVGLHRNGIIMFDEAPTKKYVPFSSIISNFVFSHNFIRHGYQPTSTTAGSGAMSFFYYTYTGVQRAKVYNNISVLVYPLGYSGGGGYVGMTGQEALIANNTVVSWTTNGGVKYGLGNVVANGFSATMTNALAYNNLIKAEGGAVGGGVMNTTGLASDNTSVAAAFGNMWHSDYNLFNGQWAGSGYAAIMFHTNFSVPYQSLQTTLASWQSIYGGLMADRCDPHSKTNFIALDSDYRVPPGDTNALGAGTNLYALGITTDFYGAPRPSSGMWTIGAVEGTNTPSQTGTRLNVAGRANLGRITVGGGGSPAIYDVTFSDFHYSDGFPSNTTAIATNQVDSVVSLTFTFPPGTLCATDTTANWYIYFKATGSGTVSITNVDGILMGTASGNWINSLTKGSVVSYDSADVFQIGYPIFFDSNDSDDFPYNFLNYGVDTGFAPTVYVWLNLNTSGYNPAPGSTCLNQIVFTFNNP